MTNTEKKITKRDNFVSILNALKDANLNDLADVMQHEIDLLDAKAVKAKERAAAKKTEADDLMNLVEAALTDELTTINDLVAKIDYDGISNAKVQARLNKLFDAGTIRKEQVVIGEGKDKSKKMAYALV